MTSEPPATELLSTEPELIDSQEILFTPDWIPDTGHSIAKVGVYVGAIRVYGEFGLDVAVRLHTVTTRRSGAVIRRTGTPHDTYYFLTEPGAGEGLRWPPGIKRLGTDRDEYVGIPALTGPTAPFVWWAAPVHSAVFVDPSILHKVCCDLARWDLAPAARATSVDVAGEVL